MKIRNIISRPHSVPQKVTTTADRLNHILEVRKIKQADLARMTGIGRGAISNYVQGRYAPKSQIIKTIAAALQVSESWLAGYDVPMIPSRDEDSPTEPQLSEGEQLLIDLFRQVPEDQQQLVLQMIRAALGK